MVTILYHWLEFRYNMWLPKTKLVRIVNSWLQINMWQLHCSCIWSILITTSRQPLHALAHMHAPAIFIPTYIHTGIMVSITSYSTTNDTLSWIIQIHNFQVREMWIVEVPYSHAIRQTYSMASRYLEGWLEGMFKDGVADGMRSFLGGWAPGLRSWSFRLIL